MRRTLKRRKPTKRTEYRPQNGLRRAHTLELLEGRQLLAGNTAAAMVTPLHNALNPRDVNRDGQVTTLDALIVVNDILVNGQHDVKAGAHPLSATGSSSSVKYVDVNGDNHITTMDALQVVNALVDPRPAQISVFVTDLNGADIDQVTEGEDFLLEARVQDTRTPAPAHPGISQAVLNVDYDGNLATATSTFTAIAPFGPPGGISFPPALSTGSIQGAGAFTLSPPAGQVVQRLWTIKVHANSAGQELFIPSLNDGSNATTFFDPVGPLGPDDITFVGDQVQIVAAPVLPKVMISDVSKNEGNSSFTDFVFNVSLDKTISSDVTMHYEVVGGTGAGQATATSDFTPGSGNITIGANQSVIPITVKVVGDTTPEPTETFNVVLSSLSANAEFDDTIGQGTIVNDDFVSQVSIADKTVQASASVETTALFTVSLASPAEGTVVVGFQTTDDTANSSNYVSTSGTLTFNKNEQTKTIPVTIKANAVETSNKSFKITLTAIQNASIVDGEAIGTIQPAVIIPVLSIGDVAQAEGNSSTQAFVFTASLSSAPSGPVEVAFATADGSAKVSDTDYAPKADTITFDALHLSRQITILVNGDTTPEPSETFAVNLTRVAGQPNIANDASAAGTINNDDGTPSFTIGDAQIISSPNSSVSAMFPVTLSTAISADVTVGFATTDGSAFANDDYLPQAGLLKFTPGGPLTQFVTVPVLAQPTPREDRSFFVTLSSNSPGTEIVDAIATGTIITQGLSVNSVNVVEGNSGTTSAVFTISLSRAQTHPVTVHYSTAEGTATAGSDYETTAGDATFDANSTAPQLVTVQIKGDLSGEPNETFTLNLSNPDGAPLFNFSGTGTILNDDGQKALIRLQLADTAGNPLPDATVLDQGDPFVLQGFVQDIQASPNGIFQAFFDVQYDANLVSLAPGAQITYGPGFLGLGTESTATAGLLDELGALQVTTDSLPLGHEQLFFSVPLVVNELGLVEFTPTPAAAQGQSDPDHEILEFTSNTPIPIGAVNFQGTSINVGENVFTFTNLSKQEGDQGTTDFVFTLNRFLTNGTQASVVYKTRDGSAVAGKDYVSKTETVSFGGSDPSKLITIQVLGDTLDEADESFFLDLVEVIGDANLSKSPGRGTILDDDPAVGVSIADANGSEGDTLSFVVKLDKISGQNVIVPYATAPATSGKIATAGADYVATSGALTFAPGVTQLSIPVVTLGDELEEGTTPETFRVVLSNLSNGELTRGTAVGSIKDVPPAIISGFVYIDLNGNGVKDANEVGLPQVTIRAHRDGDPDSKFKEVVTGDDGSFTLVVIPGTYSVREIHPAFYSDGRDTRDGVDSPTNDLFTGVTVSADITAPSHHVSGLLFGEGGLRVEFVGMFIDRRAFFSSSESTGIIGPGSTTLDLSRGDVWISFDQGWQGTRILEALFAPGSTGTTMTLYDANVKQVAASVPTATGCQLTYSNFTTSPFFLKLSGTTAAVTFAVHETVSVADVTRNEGGTGTTDFVFNVSLSAAQSSAVTVQYFTSAGSATAGSDFQSKSGSLSFAPGTTSQTVTVSVIGDSLNELNEAFFLNLKDATGITLGRSQGTGTIVNDDLSASNPSSRFGSTVTPQVADTLMAQNEDWLH